MLQFRTARADPYPLRNSVSAHNSVVVEAPGRSGRHVRTSSTPFEFGEKLTVMLTVSPTASCRWLLGEPDFRRLWLVGLVVFSVRWLEMLAVAVFAYQRTNSPFI